MPPPPDSRVYGSVQNLAPPSQSSMALQMFSWASATTASKRLRMESGPSESLHMEVYLIW
eukprot:CAMPEP_0114675368 /NCGR_PEP_ID=MMETSP0191-20121206/47791_1 /TAXON_ID=126664 /ORGANISM="Sorites sp." /LENGTH=59 /DNA_ID=CAMNT_0001944547 /DNA_START=53 /DNA_END=229 /DNA_ORIENTATION=+